MAFDDPVVLLAVPLLALLVVYQFYKRGKGKKQNVLQSLGFALLTIGIIVFILFDFLTAFLFVSVGILFTMIGEFASNFAL